MYSLRLRLSKIRHIKIIWLKTKTKSDKSYFDFEIKTKAKTNEISFYKIKTKTKAKSKVSIQILSYILEMIHFLKFQITQTFLKHWINDCFD
jgi:hypothetical protein